MRLAAGYGDVDRARRASLISGGSDWGAEAALEVGRALTYRTTVSAEAVWTSGLRGALMIQDRALRLEPKPQLEGRIGLEWRW
ncbi:MAG: hypothetical protein J4G09_09465 [Proteobacteria bacterium]|nr:hypothetical protein [Pseudomonadota bacterium]